jgi:hypothetical protein
MESIKTTNSFRCLSNFGSLIRMLSGQSHSIFRLIIPAFFLSLVFHLSLSSVYAQGPGLYKDGKKIIDLGEMIDTSLQTAPAAPSRMEPARMKLLKEIFREKIPSQVTPQKEYVRLVLECRDIVQGITSYNATDSAFADGIDRLLALEEKLAQANEALLQKFGEIEKSLKENGYPEEKIDRHIQMVKNHSIVSEHLLNLLANLRVARTFDDQSTMENVIRELNQYFIDNIFRQEPPLLNSQPLPVRMEVKQAPIIRGELVPAILYPTFSKEERVPDPGDLDSTIDVQFTDEIIALAESLHHSPVEIYNFVRDNFEFEAYLGSRKGSSQTLHHRRGNDYDQASLLIALLRVSGIPARYATGTIRMTVEQATNWLGIQDKKNAGSILTTCGMEGIIYIVNDDTVAIGCRRVWVEAWVPFINYRGAINDSVGFMWVPMDPTFKQYTYNAGINLPAEIGFDAEGFVEQYYSTLHSETPIEMYRDMLIDSLAIYHPGATYEDLITTRSVIKETDGILPGTLPYELMEQDTVFSEIPSDKRYRLRFYLYGGTGMDLDYETSLPEIAEKQVTISYVGATAEDQYTIDTAGGIFNITTPYIVDLKPVLKIDGCEVARGTGWVGLGETHDSKMYFTTPVGDFNEMPEVYNTIVAGNYQGIGIDPEDAIPSFFGPPQTACEENQLGQESHQLALTYLNKVDRGGDDLTGMMHQVVMNDVSEAIVENSVVVNMLGKYPSSIEWVGMTVDADRKIIGPFSVDGVDNDCDYMRLGGADGSIQENRLFEDRFDEEAISAIKILELASDSGIPVCEITYSIAAECPGINQPASIIDAINSALAQGHHVIIPQKQFTYYEWSGTGYIDIDPVTCAAGYIISGGHNGGATVQVWYIPWYLWFFNIRCTKAIGPVTVDPPSSNDLYCADNQASWTFHVPSIEYYSRLIIGPCFLLISLPRDFEVRYSIKYIADTWGPGEYVFRAGGPGECPQCDGVEKTVTIVKLVSVTTTGATPESGKKDHYVTIDGGADVVLKAAISPDIPASSLPPNFISWTGGSAGSDQLERIVTTGTAGNAVVKASCGAGGEEVTVHVVDAQAPGTNTDATLNDVNGSALPCSPFGEMAGDRARTGDPIVIFLAYLDGNRWILRVNSVEHTHRIGTNSGGRANVASANEPNLTGAHTVNPDWNFLNVIDDLTPDNGPRLGPDRDEFWCEDITVAHEGYHATDFHDNYWSSRMRLHETWVETDPANQIFYDCSNPTTTTEAGVVANRQPAVQNDANTRHDQAWTGILSSDPELRAHGFSNPMYVARNTAIQNRFNNPTVTVTPSGPISIPVNTDITLVALGEPQGGDYSWSGGGTPPTGTGSTFTTRFASPGNYAVAVEYSISGGGNVVELVSIEVTSK